MVPRGCGLDHRHGQDVAALFDEQGDVLWSLFVHSQGELVEGLEFYINHDAERALEAIERCRKRIYDEKFPYAAAYFPGIT